MDLVLTSHQTADQADEDGGALVISALVEDDSKFQSVIHEAETIASARNTSVESYLTQQLIRHAMVSQWRKGAKLRWRQRQRTQERDDNESEYLLVLPLRRDPTGGKTVTKSSCDRSAEQSPQMSSSRPDVRAEEGPPDTSGSDFNKRSDSTARRLPTEREVWRNMCETHNN